MNVSGCINKYLLLNKFHQYQKLLPEKSKSIIMCLLNNTIQWNLNNRHTYLGICVNKTTIGGLLNERNIRHIKVMIASEP